VETDALSERVKFILEWERRWKASKGRIDVAELSRIYGVSRQTAHVWIKRYQDAGHDLRVMQQRSRRPSSNPRAVLLPRTLVDGESRLLDDGHHERCVGARSSAMGNAPEAWGPAGA